MWAVMVLWRHCPVHQAFCSPTSNLYFCAFCCILVFGEFIKRHRWLRFYSITRSFVFSSTVILNLSPNWKFPLTMASSNIGIKEDKIPTPILYSNLPHFQSLSWRRTIIWSLFDDSTCHWALFSHNLPRMWLETSLHSKITLDKIRNMNKVLESRLSILMLSIFLD